MRRLLPRRRRRLWRYVSGRRHGVGLAVFALLVLVAYGYWSLTNDARVQRQVVRYLTNLTGGRVSIGHAEFSLFRGVRVESLRVFLSEEIDVPFFEAPQVLISHRPSALLLRGRLEPSEIVCVRPRVTLVQDVQTGEFNFYRIFPLARRAGGLTGGASLPAIRLREGELAFLDLEDGQLLPVGKRTLPWVVALLPEPDGRAYALSFEGQEGTIRHTGTIDTATGATQFTGRMIGLRELDKALPRKLRKWRQRYKLDGRVRYAGDAVLGGSSTTTGPAELKHLTVNLEDVSMELPPDEGGVKLLGVRGELVFSGSRVHIKKLTGRIGEAAGATFFLSGDYFGYEPTSPFRIALRVTDLELPLSEEMVGAWGRGIAKVHQQLTPAGPMEVRATVNRDAAGKTHVDGLAELQGVAVRLPFWPLGVEKMTGQIALGEDRVEFRGLRGRHGRAQIEVSGWLADPLGQPTGDILIAADDLPLSPEVRQSLPEGLGRAWDALSPRGRAHFAVRMQSGAGEKPTVAVTISLGGEASMEYARFPYRLEALEGNLYVDSKKAEIRAVSGKAGPMRCVLNGSVGLTGGGAPFEIHLEATDLPLDARLARALPKRARAAYEACGLSGRTDVTDAVIRRQQGGPIDFRIPAALKDATVKHTWFPYSIENAIGTVTVTPQQAAIEHLVGRHGRAQIVVSGQTPLAGDLRGCDLKVVATDLALDAELSAALPATARRGWDLLDPSGTANVTVRFRSPRSAEEGPPEYRLVAHPRDMVVRYRHFRYPLRLTAGQAVAEPGRLTLQGLRGQAGSAEVRLEGEILTPPDSERADLRVKTGPIEIDKQLLAAMPQGLVEALALRPGGRAALALDSLHVSGAAARPGGRPARGGAEDPGATTRPMRVIHRGPTTQNGPRLAWSWSGRIDLKEAIMDLGLGEKSITGQVTGKFACSGPLAELTAAADVVLESLTVGSRRLGGLTARLAKKPDSPILRIDEISGQAYGGRVAGRAEVRLASPRKYGLSLSVENVDLAKFLGTDETDPAQRSDVQGLMTGNLQLTATVGQSDSRRAKGQLQITRAKLYKLPVLLGLLHVVNLTLPGKGAFDGAEVDYYLEANKLVFREIYLTGSALSMLGAGKMNTKTEALSLTFITGPARKLPRLAAPIKELLEGIAGQLMTVRVTGTLRRPNVQTVPLRNLDKTLRELYNPEGR